MFKLYFEAKNSLEYLKKKILKIFPLNVIKWKIDKCV